MARLNSNLSVVIWVTLWLKSVLGLTYLNDRNVHKAASAIRLALSLAATTTHTAQAKLRLTSSRSPTASKPAWRTVLRTSWEIGPVTTSATLRLVAGT
jgi:hypothetical protein